MNHLYYRLALTNLKNNRQFYLPYILAGVVSAMMFYIMRAIQGNEGIDAMRGATVLHTVLFMGVVIVGACVCIFLFYTNSFVMKRRKKELGVYNILGMEKKHIAKVLAWEAVILYALSVGGGLVCGIAFNKLVNMLLYKLTGLAESIPFYISGWGCLQTAELFGIVYVLMLFYNFIQVKRANPIELLHGNNVGEREPKAKWLCAVFGLMCLVAGYGMAICADDAIKAINLFFVAVILVIAGTYNLFMYVSIAVLKLLKNNKGYYYKTEHFITVSGMMYRMKRNAVGLANICVLSTMVLVILSTTVCLYAGIENSVQSNFPKEIDTTFYFRNAPDDAVKSCLWEQFITVAKEQGRNVSDVSEYADVVFATHMEGNVVERFDNEAHDFADRNMLYIMTRDSYEKYTGATLDGIEQGAVLALSAAGDIGETITIFGNECLVKNNISLPEDFPNRKMEDFLGDTRVLYIIVPDLDTLERLRDGADVQYHVTAEIDGTAAERKAYVAALREVCAASQAQTGYEYGTFYSRAEQWEEYMKMNGGFLFLGLFLGSLFLMITVLIIYYKQISEGFEDRERFAIMTKVGMGRRMVKAAINTQVRTVFFLPITVAVIHLVMAFPMLRLMLLIFGLADTQLFMICLAATAMVFALIYFIVFKFTSKSYYRIVYQ